MGFLSDEVALTVERQNGFLVSQGVVVQAAGASIMSKEGGKHFQKLIERMTER